MKNNVIVLSANPGGRHVEGFINAGETPKPGTIMQIDPTQTNVGGRHVWKIYNPGTDGENPLGPHIVLVNDFLRGASLDVAYAAGDRCFGYIPLPGEELNLRLKNLDGTNDDHALGEKLMVDTGTGLLIPTTGTPENEVAVLKEVVTDPTTDTLAWCEWSGH